MAKSKKTKKQLTGSVLALVLCFAMLLGTTFAWFTDTASTNVNTIQAGTLDVQLLDKDGNSLEGETLAWQKAEGHENDAVLWEPGATYNLQPVTIKNNGNLALKYKLEITGIEGDAKLNEAIEWTTAVDASGNDAAAQSITEERSLAPGESDTLTISGHMKETAGNEYQGLSIEDVAITVVATQDTVEADSNGTDYDANATYPEIVSTPDELAAALLDDAAVINVKLDKNINLDINKLSPQVGGTGQYRLGGENTKVIDIDLGGHKMTLDTNYMSALGAKNSKAVINVTNGTVDSTQATGTWNTYDLMFHDCQWNFNNVKFDKAVAVLTDASFTNVTITETSDVYALWITADGQTVTADKLTINSAGRAIAIKDQYVGSAKSVTLNIKDSKITSQKKAAVLVTSTAGATINASNVNITNVAADSKNLVWIDEANPSAPVTVKGGTAVVEK